MITNRRSKGRTLARIGVVAALTAGTLVGLSSSSQAAAGSVTVTPATGQATTATAVSLVGKGFKNVAGGVLSGDVEFNADKCAAAKDGGTDATGITVVSATKIVATSPSLAAGTAGVSKAYNICVYNAAGTALLASGKFTIYSPPAVSAISATGGPATGGNTLGLTGTFFTKGSKVKIGGTAAVKVTYVDEGTLTVTVPAHAVAADAQVQVTTEGGASTDVAADNYDYVSAISVSPTTAPKATAQVLTITGSGFSTGYTFRDTAASSPAAVDTSAGVFLFSGAYAWLDTVDDSVPDGAAAQCIGVTVVSDNELTCTVAGADITNDGSYTVYVLSDRSSAATASKVTSGATYTAAEF